MAHSAHLLLPLAASVLFVVGAMFAKRGTLRGASPYTTTLLANLCLAICWGVLGLVHSEGLPAAVWPAAALIALAFVAGQFCTFLAFQFGDVSLATPVFGVKIILVALLSSLLTDQPVAPRIWIAAILAAAGIGVIQAGSGSSGRTLTARRAALAIGLALLAATSLSLFDVGLQEYAHRHGAERFLTTMFVFTGLISLVLVPWCDRPGRLRRIGALWPLVAAATLVAAQAIAMSYALGRYGDATRVNIVYSLRGLWSVVLAWLLSRSALSPESAHSKRTLAVRLLGACLLTAAVVAALS